MIQEKQNKIFIFAGEKSGDLHGSHLALALKKQDPSLIIEGVCGPNMRTSCISGPINMEEFEVMGLTDVLLALPKLYRHFHTVRDFILKSEPKAVILIDYPGFNLRLARSLRKLGYQGKLIQYVSPSVWAWGSHRIQAMAETLDLLMTIYPFEKSYFEESSLKVSYVGNPIQEYIHNYVYDEHWKQKLAIPNDRPLFAIFPGSRPSETARNLPVLLSAAKRLKHDFPNRAFAISCSGKTAEEAISRYLANDLPSFQKDLFLVPKNYTYELMRDSRTAIAKSGTVTLELALHGRPTVAMYQLTTVNRLYAKHILKLKLPNYCIVNILTKKQTFPELIEKKLTEESLYQLVKTLDEEGPCRANCINACLGLQPLLGAKNASDLAADAVLRCIKC